MKSQAVFVGRPGIPVELGELNVAAPSRPGLMHAGLAKLPGVVTLSDVPGLPPTGGRT